MKTKVSLLSLTLVVMMSCFVLPSCRKATSNQHCGAVIQFEDTILNLGDIPIDKVHRFSFKFKNVGDGPLVVWDVKPDCGSCTKVDYPTDSIQPNEIGEIFVSFDGSDRYIAGPHEFYIHVRTNTDREFNDLTFMANLTN